MPQVGCGSECSSNRQGWCASLHGSRSITPELLISKSISGLHGHAFRMRRARRESRRRSGGARENDVRRGAKGGPAMREAERVPSRCPARPAHRAPPAARTGRLEPSGRCFAPLTTARRHLLAVQRHPASPSRLHAPSRPVANYDAPIASSRLDVIMSQGLKSGPMPAHRSPLPDDPRSRRDLSARRG